MSRYITGLCAALFLTVMVGGASAQLPPPGWAPDGSPVAKYGRLQVRGARLMAENGTDTVQLRGMSLFWSSDSEYAQKFYNERVVAYLYSNWRATLIRAAMGVSTSDDGDTYMKSPALAAGNISRVDRVVKGAIEQGMYVIIDWHSHKAEQEQAAAKDFFEQMARKYKDYPNVMYEIYNEPVGQGWGTVKSYAETVIDAIRAIDPHNIIMVGTPQWCQNVNDPVGNPITGRTNIMYTVHFYRDHTFQSSFQSAANSQPFFASEWGVSHSSGNDSGNEYQNTGNIDAWLTALDSRKTSWANWSITNKNETASALKFYDAKTQTSENERLGQVVGGWSDADLTFSGLYVRGKLRAANPGTHQYKINITPVGQGTVAGAGNVNIFTPVTLTATPAANQRFEGWVINGVATSVNPFSLGEVFMDRIGTAVFFPENLLNNSTFTTGGANWAASFSAGTQGTSGHYRDGDVSAFRVNVTQAHATLNRNARLSQTGISLTGGRKYELTFKAWTASGERKITPAITNGSTTLFADTTGNSVTLSTMPQDFKFEFNMGSSSNSAAVEFHCGLGTGEWFITNISLVDAGTGSSADASRITASAPFRAVRNGNALTISGTTGRKVEVAVYDMAGRVRLSRSVSLSGAGSTVSLDRLPAGVYTARYKVDGKAIKQSDRIMIAK